MQHPDEGIIHAWLDEALPQEEADRIDAHVRSCAECSAAVAEARGLIAASSRILGKLDHVPGGVTTQSTETRVPGSLSSPNRPEGKPVKRWFNPRYAAAAAIAIVAIGTWATVRERSESTPLTASAPPLADASTPAPATPIDSVSAAPAVAAATPERKEREKASPRSADAAKKEVDASSLRREAPRVAPARVAAPPAANEALGRFRAGDSARSESASRPLSAAKALQEVVTTGATAERRQALDLQGTPAGRPLAFRTQAEIDSVVNLFSGCFSAVRGVRALEDGFPAQISLLTRQHRRIGAQQTWIATPESSVPANVTWEWSLGAAFNVTLQRVAGGPLLSAEFSSGSGADVVLRRIDCR
jgi:hypothetical protein